MSKHNYRRQIETMYQRGDFGGKAGCVGVMEIRHDDWCGFLHGGSCNCQPEIVTRWLPDPRSN